MGVKWGERQARFWSQEELESVKGALILLEAREAKILPALLNDALTLLVLTSLPFNHCRKRPVRTI